MSEFFFVIGDKEEGPAELYASVVAIDAATAANALRSEIDSLVGDGIGVEIPIENGVVTKLLVGINTRRITDEDALVLDDDGLQWDGEEIATTGAPEYTEAIEVKELEELPAHDKFTLMVRQRQSAWQSIQTPGLQFGVAKSGGVSVYGLNRYPVTLYYEQWVKLLEVADDLRRFIEGNKALLKRKVPR